MKKEEETALRVVFNRGVNITAINRQGKTVTDDEGNLHAYDLLIIATGSRAAMLKDTPALKGIFTMRNRDDADSFMRHIAHAKGKVLIVGGGLLGIELAASLHETNIPACILQRSSKLMDRQLDALGCQLLHEELTDKGIEVLFNDEIERFTGTTQIKGVKLKSGLELSCAAVVMAIGTTPNVELAKAAGLYCKRGIIVNEYLQTEDPAIYAIGEVAEFNGMLYGITAAAEEQAEIVANYLAGDISRYYQGSLLMNILKMAGTDICSIGLADAPAGDHSYEEILFIDKSKRYYKKCIIHNDRLVGAILIGDKSEFVEFKNLIQNKIELSEKRMDLLRSGKKAEPVEGKIVCSCGNVGEGNIINKIKGGCTEMSALCQATGAGLGCGSCKPEVKAILDAQVKTVLIPPHAKETVMDKILQTIVG